MNGNRHTYETKHPPRCPQQGFIAQVVTLVGGNPSNLYNSGQCHYPFPDSQKRLIMGNQDYQVLVQKVTMYLDNELSENEERELLQDIQSNPSYLKVLSQEKSFREFIKSKIQRRKPSPALIQSIKEKIRIAPL